SPQAFGQFVLRLGPDGSTAAATPLGVGTGSAPGAGVTVPEVKQQSLAMAPSGLLYVTGMFQGAANIVAPPLNSAGENDVFVASLNSNLQVLGANKAGGAGLDFPGGIAVSANPGKVGPVIVGSYTPNATFGQTTLQNLGAHNIFVAKL